MGSGLLVLSVGEGVRQGDNGHSCMLSSGGRISKTFSTTGDEVFFKLATASPRVTPVKSTPFTFSKMSPAGKEVDSTVHPLPTVVALLNAFQKTWRSRDLSSACLIFSNLPVTTQRQETECHLCSKRLPRDESGAKKNRRHCLAC